MVDDRLQHLQVGLQGVISPASIGQTAPLPVVNHDGMVEGKPTEERSDRWVLPEDLKVVNPPGREYEWRTLPQDGIRNPLALRSQAELDMEVAWRCRLIGR